MYCVSVCVSMYEYRCVFEKIILQINGKEIGIDVMCDDAIHLLTDNSPSVTLELARPKKHVSTYVQTP